jgi:SAM-dependent methyltransferase
MVFQDEFHDLTDNFYSTRREIVAIDEDEYEALAKQVGWQSYDSQKQNFDVATDLDNISWNSVGSVLDVGCGYGELVRYLREEKAFEGTYTGVDILDRFIHRAAQLYGEDNRNAFICGDILACSQLLSSYDVVISMGTLSINYDYPSSPGERTEWFTNHLIELICSLAKSSAVLYFIDEDKTPFMERIIADNMAFYNSEDIRNRLIHRSKRNINQLTMESYPNPNSCKTIAKLYYTL